MGKKEHDDGYQCWKVGNFLDAVFWLGLGSVFENFSVELGVLCNTAMWL